MNKVVDLVADASALTQTWSPRVVAQTNGQLVKVVKVAGEFVWHDHAKEDELFLVLTGELRIEFKDRDAVRIGPGQMYVVPRGIRHNPVAARECLMVLIEPATTTHTGELWTERTRSLAEQFA